MDIFDKAGMDTVGKVGIAAHITCSASPAARNTDHTVADTTDYNASSPTRYTDHTVAHTTEFHIGRNNREYILVLVRHGCVGQTNIKA